MYPTFGPQPEEQSSRPASAPARASVSGHQPEHQEQQEEDDDDVADGRLSHDSAPVISYLTYTPTREVQAIMGVISQLVQPQGQGGQQRHVQVRQSDFKREFAHSKFPAYGGHHKT